MTRIAIYTLTRERLPYTQHCFQTLWDNAGQLFDHYVIDNGSQDGTSEWLTANKDRFASITCLPENRGISVGSNLALQMIYASKEYDLIIKMDNDCEVISPDILKHIVEVYESIPDAHQPCILSPRVEGIVNQPHRGYERQFGTWKIGMTAIVGGLFHIVPARVYKMYTYPTDLPKARGQDDVFCYWARSNKMEVGYIEDLVVGHYETTGGQAKRFPEYFKRKHEEEKV